MHVDISGLVVHMTTRKNKTTTILLPGSPPDTDGSGRDRLKESGPDISRFHWAGGLEEA